MFYIDSSNTSLLWWNTLIEHTGNLGTCMKYISKFKCTGVPASVFLVVMCNYTGNMKYLFVFVLLVGLLCCNSDSVDYCICIVTCRDW